MVDDPQRLLDKIRLGEDSVLELQSVRIRGTEVVAPARQPLADRLAGLANTAGGTLVLGVDDRTRSVRGIPLDALDHAERMVREVCTDAIRPPLPCRILRLELPDAARAPRPVLVVEVPRSLFVHKSPGGYMHRVGSLTQEMPTEYLARLLQRRGQARLLSFDEHPVATASWDDLDWHALQPFLPPDAGHDRTTARKLNVATEREGQDHLTVGGVLLFGRDPQAHLPNAVIDAALYRGVDRDSNEQLDAHVFDGAIRGQIDEAVQFVLRRQRVRASKTPHRTDRPQYDERAIFEAVVNAVVHRDYAIGGSKIRLFMFDDRLEIHVPGALPNSVTADTLADRQATRNALLVRFLSRTPVDGRLASIRGAYMEARGEGVPLIMRRSRELSGREPAHAMHGEELQLTIFAAP